MTTYDSFSRTYNMPIVVREKHHKSSYQTRKLPDGQNVSSSSSDGLVQNCMTLSLWFSHKTAAFYTEQCTSPSLFYNFEVSQGGSNRSLNNYSIISNAIFKNWCMCTNHLATNSRLLN